MLRWLESQPCKQGSKDWRIISVRTTFLTHILLGLCHSRLESLNRSIALIICTLVSWLHLSCGLSRAAAGKVLRVFQATILAAIQLGMLMARSTSDPRIFSLPRDLRTAMSNLSIEPNIIRSICCPKCYTKYALHSMPQVCSYRETPRSHRCGEDLWTTRSTRAGPREIGRAHV